MITDRGLRGGTEVSDASLAEIRNWSNYMVPYWVRYFQFKVSLELFSKENNFLMKIKSKIDLRTKTSNSMDV